MAALQATIQNTEVFENIRKGKIPKDAKRIGERSFMSEVTFSCKTSLPLLCDK